MTPEAKPVSTPKWIALEPDENSLTTSITFSANTAEEIGINPIIAKDVPLEYAELIVRAVNRDNLFNELVEALNELLITCDKHDFGVPKKFEQLLTEAKELSK